MSTLIIYPLDDASVEQSFVLDCDEVDISLTFSVQDIQDVTKRRGSFSKTITLPGTSSNNQAFGHAYNIQSFVGGFTPNKRIRCTLWNDGIQTFTGTLQLLSITKTKEQIDYEVGIYSEEIAFFRQINETKLVDTVGVSGFNHAVTAASVSGTWSAPAGSGYVYGFLDGFGYSDVNPEVFSAVQQTLVVPYFNLTPSFYVKQLVDLIFAQSGYRYQSAFFNTANFNKLVLPYAGGATLQNNLSSQNSDVRTNAPLINNEDNFTLWSTSANGLLEVFVGVIAFDQAIFDPVFYWDLVNHRLRNVPWYSVWDVNYELTVTNTSATTRPFFVAICDADTGIPLNVPEFDADYIIQQDRRQQLWYSGILDGVETRTFNFQGRVRLNPNQRIDLRIFYRTSASAENKYFIRVEEKASLQMICVENTSIAGFADMKTALPPDITQADLLSDLQKMFNLFFYQSPSDPNLIFIEPFNTFYSSGSVNWTEKIDNTDKHLLQMGDPQARKQLTFKYKDSGDALGKLYSGTFAEGYGSRMFQTQNYYAKGEQVVETKCATVIPASFGTGLVIGRTFDIDSNNKPKARANGYRIAQFNYIRTPNNVPWAYLTTASLSEFTFQAVVEIPLIAHIDNPYAPTFDLAFGMPKNLYFQVFDGAAFANYNNNNLFNNFWLNYILETTSKESLQIEIPVILNPVDIYQLDFRKPIYIEGILFRLLEVKDYVIGGSNKCTAVLRRILNLAAPATGAVPVNTFFDPSNLVLGEMKPQIVTPNNIQ